jgi:mannose-6-phosphate isomerase-like protein (cupin superfamily)
LPVNLVQKLSLISEQWTPKVVAALNDYQVKLVKLEGEFTWHSHEETDELFLVLYGSMDIWLRDRIVTLAEGELFVVPRGVEHCPRAAAECHVLLFVPSGIVNTGEAGGELTAANDEWL